MIMLEEFRRRKKLKDYYELMRKREYEKTASRGKRPEQTLNFDKYSLDMEEKFRGTGPERHFYIDEEEIFDTS